MPPTESAARGTCVHTILEKWLTDGTAPDLLTEDGEIAAAGFLGWIRAGGWLPESVSPKASEGDEASD